MSQEHPKSSEKSTVLTLLVAAAAFVIIISGLKVAGTIVVPFLLAVFIAVICAPLMVSMQRIGINSVVAIFVIVTFIAVSGMMMIGVLGSSLTDFSQKLPEYFEGFFTDLGKFFEWLESKGVKVEEDQILSFIKTGNVLELVRTSINNLLSLFSQAFLILLIVIFILLELSGMPRKIASITKGDPAAQEYLYKIVHDVRRYMALKTLVSIATGILIYLCLTFLGVSYPVMWGILAFFFNFVPNIGSIIAALPAVLLALIESDISTALWTTGAYLLINVVIGNFIEPRFMGRGLDLSALVVFISLLFWGWVLGPVGMLLSVPLTMTVKIALASAPETRWIAILLGGDVSDSYNNSTTEQTE